MRVDADARSDNPPSLDDGSGLATRRTMQILLVNPQQGSLPQGATELVNQIGWDVSTARDYQTALETARAETIDVIVMPQPRREGICEAVEDQFKSLIRLIDAERIVTFLFTNDSGEPLPESRAVLDLFPQDVSLDELRGRFAMIERYHSRFTRMEQEIHNLERLGKRLNQHFREMDQEMRLAARLQRDFLPHITEPIRNVRFATLYRPASWVSGDIFDVFRIDENHTGFYIADAVGHGVAASLLTMFIKRSIITKRNDGDKYDILRPSETMTILNESLADQSLPNCQFVTACYGLINHETLTLSFARGGHPHPILVTSDGTFSELKASGGLLGLFKGEEFTEHQVQLHTGDKLLLYTDGVELAFQEGEESRVNASAYLEVFRDLADHHVEDMLRAIECKLNDERGSLNPRDDITLVALEILGSEHESKDAQLAQQTIHA